jgi:hypothetical protein
MSSSSWAPERPDDLSIDVDTGHSRLHGDAGPAVPLFTLDAASITGGFDVAPDGKSFVVGRDVSASSGAAVLRTKFTLVENWFSEFARRAR